MAVLDPRDRRGLPIGLGGKIAPSRACRRALGPRRAFTLLELVAVVSIVTIFAALAIPSAVNQLRDRRVQEAARQLAIVYRQARMHALGRGSAVLVHFEDGDITVREARLGEAITEACMDLPVSSCVNTEWDKTASYRVIDGFHVPASGDMSTLELGMRPSGSSTALSYLDVCFTPIGRAFSRTVGTDPLTPISDTFIATLTRPGSRQRLVALFANGTARLFTPGAPEAAPADPGPADPAPADPAPADPAPTEPTP